MHDHTRDYGDADRLDPSLLAAIAELRAPVEPSAEFEVRVMGAVREAADTSELTFTPWWRRRSIRISPAAALAIAAGIAFVAFLGARSVEVTDQQPIAAATEPAAAQVVRFVYVDRNASQVSLVGNFNQWQKDVTPLQATGVPGVWAVAVPLEPGMHEYAFIVDGERWAPDPLAPGMTDEFGTESSIVRVQGPTAS